MHIKGRLDLQHKFSNIINIENHISIWSKLYILIKIFLYELEIYESSWLQLYFTINKVTFSFILLFESSTTIQITENSPNAKSKLRESLSLDCPYNI